MGVGRRGLLAAAALLALAGSRPVVQALDLAPVAQKPAVDLQVARAGAAGCGPWADQLPGLVDVQDARPRALSTLTFVCLRNVGTQKGHVQLGVADLSDTDIACGPDEGQVDSTCGGGRAGELGASLRQGVLAAGCRDDGKHRTVSAGAPALLSLQVSPIAVASDLRGNDVRCVALVTAYLPADERTAHAAQSDRTTWRFSFSITQD